MPEIKQQITGFKKLQVWQEAHAFVLLVYQVTANFPREERLALTSQLRRAVFSIAANIVEGYAYHSNKTFLRYLAIAEGSLAESEYYLLLAKDLGLIKEADYLRLEEKRAKVGAYLYKFKSAVRAQVAKGERN
jgi:four helix bundle protein